MENCPHSKVTVCTEDALVPLLELMMPSVEVNVEHNQRSCCKTSQEEPEATKICACQHLMVVEACNLKMY